MLYYSPQIWTSDNMDPIQRLLIQEGTALIYPLSTMGAHVCVEKNHCNGRVSPLHTRANVAMSGTFGYELDVTKLSEGELEQCARLNRDYRRFNPIVREGNYYRIASCRENGSYDCWQVVSPGGEEFLLTYVQVRFEARNRAVRLRLEGLESGARYRLSGTDRVFSGALLMNAGYPQKMLWGDNNSTLLHFVKVTE
jgi:alpha-galactosidase